MSLKVITIDFWNTIYDSSGGFERNAYRQRALLEEIDKYGLVVKSDEFLNALQASWQYFNDIWLNEQRTPNSIETVEFLWNYLKLPKDINGLNKVTKAFEDSNLYYPPKLIYGVEDSLKLLSQKYKFAVVSDTGFSPGSILKEMMRKDNILEYFSAFSFSNETGVSKPNEKAFLHVLNLLECKPNEALHIGDIEKTDIIGAKKVGMKAFRFTGDMINEVNWHDSKETIADAQTESWYEIPILIEKLGF